MSTPTPKRLHLLNEIVRKLSGESDLQTGMLSALGLLRRYFGAPRAFIFEFGDDPAGLRFCFEDGDAAGGPDGTKLSQGLVRLSGLFPGADCLAFDADGPEDVSRFLSENGLGSLLAAPLYAEGLNRGYVTICEPTEHRGDTELLSTVGYVLAADLGKRAVIDEQTSLAAHYSAIVEALPGGVAVFDFAPGRKLNVSINDAYAQILGAKRAEAEANLAREPLHYICPEDRQRIQRTLKAFWRRRTGSETLSYRIVRADGGSRSLSESLMLIDHGNKHLTMFVSCTDVTDAMQFTEQLREEKARMEKSGERYRIALQSTSLSIWDYDHRTGRIIPSPEDSGPTIENVPASLVESGYIHPDYVDDYLNMYARLRSGEKYVEGVFRVRSDEHPAYWYEHIRYTNIFDAEGKPYMAVGMSEDVTEKYAAQQNYARELQLQQMLADDMFATMLLDVTNWTVTRFQCRDPQFSAILESRDADQIIRAAAESVVDDDKVKSFFEGMTQESLIERYAAKDDTIAMEYRRRLPSGKECWMREVIRMLAEPDSGRLMLFMQLRDVDAEKRRLDELAHAAETDSMTGFLDHNAAMRYMRSFLLGEGRHGRHALFMIDIDNFKSVNDRLGHIKGDEVITRIAHSIRSLFRGSDLLGRIGGDEFLVLMKNVATSSLVVKKASDLVDALQFVCAGENVSINLSASVGVCLYTKAEESLDALYASADAALYRAKNAGKNRYAISAGNEHDAEVHEEAGPSGIVQLRTLLEYMDGGVILAEVGEKINVTYVSPSFFKTMSRSQQEAGEHGEKLVDFVVEEDRPSLISALRYVAESGELRDIAFRVRLADGSIGWRRLRTALLPGSASSLPQLIGVLSDITEMQRSAAQLEAIIENAPCGIGMLEYDGKHLKPMFFNDTVLKMARAGSKEAFFEGLGGDAFTRVCEEEQPHLINMLNESLEKNTHFETIYHSKALYDGTSRAIHIRGLRLPEFEKDQHPVFLMMYTDVTRQAEMESALRLAEERYRIAMTCADIMLWEVDIPARTMRQSPEVAKRFAHNSIEISDLPEGMLRQGNISPDSVAETRRMFENMFAGKDDEEYFARSRFDGEYMWLKIRFKVLRNEAGEPYYAVCISEPVPNVDAEMRRFEQEYQLSTQLESKLMACFHVNLSKDRVDYFYADDGPWVDAKPKNFADLRSMGEQLAADGEDPEEFLAHLSLPHLFTMFRANQRYLFISFLRKSSDGSPRWTDCSIHLMRHPVSGDLYAFFYLRDADARRRWELSLPRAPEYDSATLLYTAASMEALVQSILADSRHKPGICAMTVLELVGIEQVRAIRSASAVNELMFTIGRIFRVVASNEAFASLLDDSHIAVFRTDAASSDAQQIRIREMREHIVGTLRRMHPDDPIDLVFGFATERLQTADYAMLLYKAKLACRSALSWSDSSIARYAELGKGPDADTPLPPVPEYARENTILIADDAPSYREMMQTLFELDYTVLMAENGAQALESMEAHPEISAVILDLIMPEMNGFEVLEAMQADERLSRLPVVVVTTDDDPKSEARALDLGAADVIAKPFYGQTMLRRVRNIIARSDAARMAEQNRDYELRFQQQANMLRLADYDELTGVYNKRAFCAHVRDALDAQPDGRYLILRWDIDRFKVFNDAFGTHAGDTLLREIGAIMHKYAVGNIYGHLEADHFALWAPDESAVVDRFISAVTDFLKNYPVAFNFMPRFGVYHIEDASLDVSLMCDRALLALRSIKGSYTNAIAYYDISLRKRLLDEQELIGGMQAALDREEFVLYFQPQYNYASGELVGAEALVRWLHPTRGLLMPSEFIPLFENNGFISQLDWYVWERSCRAMRHWLDNADRLVPVSIAVNISRLDIYNPQLCSMLKSLVDQYGLSPAFLKLEITETAYMENPEQLIEVVTTLQELGFTVEMDDFGSGYSSLNTLKDVPVDVLKLDIKFLTSGVNDARGGNILSSVIRMARWLQLPVIAEGVETREQADYLNSLGCAYMQGYFFAKPMPAEEFEELLKTSRLGATDMYKGANVRDAAAFWDASAQTALIFNSLVGAAAILEYRGGQVEALRINDSFFSELGTTREAYADAQMHMLDRLSTETRPYYIAMLERAIATGEEATCEVFGRPSGPDLPGCWTRSRARLLAQSGDSYLFYASLENITERKELERQLLLSSHNDMLLSVYDEIFEFDYENETVTVRASTGSNGIYAGRQLPLMETIEHWCERHVAPEDRPKLLELVSPETRHIGALEYRYTRADGATGRISAVMLRISETVYLLCNLDITE